ncbi:hypothetical protein ACFSCX_22230 [Bacillus salitolerans]|uniref:Uncharacterized protein n=1 Tax=Bacillus salitolerans TaxID=1437434 RepID=A0ABW4LVJ8_9BACI
MERDYQDRPLNELVNLFHIVYIVSQIPNEKLSNLCHLGDNQQKSLEWLINDYFEHMEYHIHHHILIKK